MIGEGDSDGGVGGVNVYISKVKETVKIVDGRLHSFLFSLFHFIFIFLLFSIFYF